MSVFFLLLVIIVQIGFAVTARSMVGASVDAAARRVSMGAEDEATLDRVRREVLGAVPGVEISHAAITRDGATVTVALRYRWLPPGPDLVPIDVAVERTRTVAVPP